MTYNEVEGKPPRWDQLLYKDKKKHPVPNAVSSRRFHCISPNWASEASPTLGCSIEISHDIYIYK